MEPLPETYQIVGRICVAWSYFEARSESTLVGLLDLDERLCKTFLWRMGIRDRWQMIDKEAPNRLAGADLEVIESVSRKAKLCMRDRNIIVHGLVHARADTRLLPDKTPNELARDEAFTRVPCWTAYMGEGKGRNYRIARASAEVVLSNIQKTAEELTRLNQRLGYRHMPSTLDHIEDHWPQQL